MESMDNVRERIEALEQQRKGMGACTRSGERRLRWWPLAWPVAVGAALGLALALPVQAKTFRCAAGDVPCLIAAINEANANGQENTIRLEAGTYPLTTPDNPGNGLPVITSPLTITGRGADTTIIERVAGAPGFRFLTVAETGTLTLRRLTLRGGLNLLGDGGGILNRGRLALVHTTVADNTALGAGGIAHYGATLTITHSTIESNGTIVGGGGMRIGPPSEDPPRRDRLTTITATSITRNRTQGGGGGISHLSGTVLITASAISENVAESQSGGGS